MNRKERRALQRDQHYFVKQLPAHLVPLSPEYFPRMQTGAMPVKAWESRNYLVQLYREDNVAFPSLLRLSICRSKIGTNGKWKDGMTWEELQDIKREVGFGDWYGVEVYPRDADIVNVANFRHLWLMPTPLMIGWEK